ncbi:COX15/CtaA family protein [Massilia sp. S19_KUP03_FR1]|uniref:COX15/CtaA family protein n=1 Tax=Massilia sp. S19_KUP03_FR1 TaxID=3025503 RepID=UPI002FCD526F
MTFSHLALLLLTGLIAATLPLTLVWMSTDANKYRKLVWITAFLTFDLIVFGGFTRLTDSGLGCPDWPGCYGMANPFLAHEQVSAAQAAMPTGPVTVAKAWIEMVHRYLAMGIGVLLVSLMVQAWRHWKKTHLPTYAPGLPTLLFVFVLVQGAFGAWTVTLKLQPVIVTIHLLLGMGLLAMVTWLGCRQDLYQAGGRIVKQRAPRWPYLLAAATLALQIALGGWVSTNYATLACSDFPTCNGTYLPEMDFEHGFTLWRELGKTAAGHYIPMSALTAIHWVHRNFAVVLVLVLGYAAWRARTNPRLRPLSRSIAIVLALQACTGIATVYFSFPLTLAVLHNAGAALLVLLVTMLNYRSLYQIEAASPVPAQPIASAQLSPASPHP